MQLPLYDNRALRTLLDAGQRPSLGQAASYYSARLRKKTTRVGMQVLLRVQLVGDVPHGRSVAMTANMAGLGVSVVGALQSELTNITLKQTSVHYHRLRAEETLKGSVGMLQVDNQLLSAKYPVVLAPAAARSPVCLWPVIVHAW